MVPEYTQPKADNRFAWRIGGPQGSGIDRLATVFGRLCAGQGLHLYSRREYHSNIIGLLLKNIHLNNWRPVRFEPGS